MDQEILETRAKHICQSMHEEKWQEILDDLLVHEVIKESINDANHKGPEKPLIGVERKTDQS